MKKYLVTGAAGFIGSAVAKRLLDSGHHVTTIDNLSTGFVENIPRGVELIKGNCQDPKVIERLGGKRYNAIIHLAGQSSGEISFDDPAYDLSTNAESTVRLVKYCLETGCQRFIYASTMTVYGVVPVEPIPEDFEPKPLSFYGVGKLASEHYLRIFSNYGIKPTVLRYFSVYGPGQNMANLRQGMVSIYLAQALTKGSIYVKGAPDRFRDFIYIDDIVDITVDLINNEKSFGGTFNIGTGKMTTVGEILRLIHEILGDGISIEFGESTPGDQRGIYADITRMREILGYHPKVSFPEGLRKMVDWARGLDLK